MIYLGYIETRAELPEVLITRSEATQYYDILTLQPMLQIIEHVGFIKYHATMRGRDIQYLDIGEIQKWGETKGYDFWHSSEISCEWREYLRTLDRIYADVARLNELGRLMEFDDEEMQSIPPIKHNQWPWKSQAITLRHPRKPKKPKSCTQEIIDQKVPSALYYALEEKYKQLRSKLEVLAKKSKRNIKAPFSIMRQGNRFGVRIRRKVLNERINLYRSFFIESEAINWAREISEELGALEFLSQIEFLNDSEDEVSVSKLSQNPDEYLKLLNGYMAEMARNVIATELPTEDGEYACVESIHQRSIAFEKTVFCGIYFLIGDGEIKYVGQSIDILKRIREHWNHAYINFDRFSMIPVPLENLAEVETWYIRHFRPKHNRTRRRPFPAETRVQRKREIFEKRLV